MGYGAKPQKLGILLFTFNCKLQKKLGEHYVLVAPPIIFLGELLLPWFPCLWMLLLFIIPGIAQVSRVIPTSYKKAQLTQWSARDSVGIVAPLGESEYKTTTYWLKIVYFWYPCVIQRPRSLSSLSNFTARLSVRKLESWGYSVVKAAWSYLQPSLTDPPVWQTDGRTGDGI